MDLEQAAIAPALAVIDFSLLKKYIHPDPAIFMPLLHEFLASLADQSATLTQAFNARDWQVLASASHKLKGSAAYYGALQLQAACGQLQHIAIDASVEQITPQFQSLKQALDNLAAFSI